jgi:hypothetical protein
MKLEINLTEAEHRYLLEAAAHDRSFRSLLLSPRIVLLTA